VAWVLYPALPSTSASAAQRYLQGASGLVGFGVMGGINPDASLSKASSSLAT